MVRRTWSGLAASSVLALTLSTIAIPAYAQDVDSLISEIEEISQQTSAKSEEVKVLEDDIKNRELGIESIQSQVKSHRETADEAAAAADSYRGEINRIAQAKYRGSVLDPLTVAISAENPQNVIDRMSYISTISKSSADIAQGLNAETARAADSLDEANRMKAEADFQLAAQRSKLEQLSRDQEDLDRRKEEVRAQVEALSPEDRQRWIAKNDPLNIDISEFLGVSGESGGAVQAALSKIGSPYGWGAIGPNEFDCSGLIYWAYQQQGKTLPRTSQAQMAGGTPVSRDQLQPGDVIGYYAGATHVGLYIGDGKIVHASDYGIPVQVVSVDSAPFYGARRY